MHDCLLRPRSDDPLHERLEHAFERLHRLSAWHAMVRPARVVQLNDLHCHCPLRNLERACSQMLVLGFLSALDFDVSVFTRLIRPKLFTFVDLLFDQVAGRYNERHFLLHYHLPEMLDGIRLRTLGRNDLLICAERALNG